MKFLLTNDDGIDHAGLNALLEAAQNFGDATIVDRLRRNLAQATPSSGTKVCASGH